ncbi:hypothetical protein [Kribbella lupini]|uniref:Uncharacterized protein n=1 Tax=Kribbella lupini TaxID=291602 RepID=A0ABN2CCH7_9ACTN
MPNWSPDDRTELDRMLAAAAEKKTAGLDALRAEAASASPSHERTAALVQLYCADHAAVGHSWDRAAHTFVIRLAADHPGTSGEVVDLGGAEALVAHSRHTQAEIDLVLNELRLRRWHPDARTYAYGFGYDAVADVVDVETNAPPEVVAPLLARYPTALAVRHGRATGRG